MSVFPHNLTDIFSPFEVFTLFVEKILKNCDCKQYRIMSINAVAKAFLLIRPRYELEITDNGSQ